MVLYKFSLSYTEVDNREAPSITKSPLSKIVKLNNRVVLTCSAAGNPTPSIRWYKDGKVIKGPQAIGDVFIISEVTPNKRGFYQCEAFSSFGQPSKSMNAVILIQGWNSIVVTNCTMLKLSDSITYVNMLFCRYCPVSH